jgi:hypothetical protein
MMRIAPFLALAACSPGAPDYVPPDDADLSYGSGWVLRVEDDACGFRDDQPPPPTMGGVVQVENRYRETTIAAVLVGFGCGEAPQGAIAPGDTLVVGAQIGEVVRIELEDATVLSAWELFFMDGGTVVIQ